ncbi:endonuclease/exonuclease/phosphatase family protein [Flavobacterium aquicola]|uniref:Exonuclease III n=1 Tax=Flavobacterium aquicola TaxID=1682742 RepID=A0A3E0EPB1_9FLAO|nr:endonuclease/exonuclease/phosphatase family protein [Flavobacterium aquicola]REH00083.1 exonuclease III [Flavobacterium aquicola]
MKLITWNCNMAFRKKAEFILKEQPDILIVPECEHPDKLIFKNTIAQPTNQLWFGQNHNKGLGIFSYSDFKIELLSIHNAEFKYVLPLLVSNNKFKVIIFAIWAQKPEKHDCYTEQVWNAIHFYSDLLDNENVILAGDFNSNSIWDKPNRIYNHTNLVGILKNKNIFSTYHTFHNQEQGKETTPTLFMHRKLERPYHIDFCFASKNLIDKMKSVEIGKYENWTKHSDHKPLTVTFEI